MLSIIQVTSERAVDFQVSNLSNFESICNNLLPNTDPSSSIKLFYARSVFDSEPLYTLHLTISKHKQIHMIFKLIHNKEIHMLNKQVTHSELVEFVKASFRKVPKTFSLSYMDADGDVIAITGQEDLNVVYSMGTNMLRIIIEESNEVKVDTEEDEPVEIITEPPVVSKVESTTEVIAEEKPAALESHEEKPTVSEPTKNTSNDEPTKEKKSSELPKV